MEWARLEMRLIRRYSNRKLYDPSESRYLKLSDVAALVRQGENFRVVEHRTQRDLTTAVLAQIIYEEEKAGPRLPANELVRIIRHGLFTQE
jgi:polyhydroxyalkanoate synthesis repressor PhaR